MATKYLCGVADAFGYDANDNLLFVSKTMLTDSIEITTDKTEIRAGQGNQLRHVYFHTSAMTGSLEEAQWNLDYIAANMGSSVVTGAGVWKEENVTLGAAGAGSVTETPIATASGSIYGWVTQSDGTVTRVTFTAKDFTLAGGTENEVVCVRYFYTNSAARQITVSGDILPSVVRLVLDAKLFSSDSGTASALIGKVLVEVPKFQLDGNQSIELTSSGVSKTSLKGMALSSFVAGCTGSAYATITEVVEAAHWYDNVFALALADDTIALTAGTSPKTMVVYAIPTTGSAFIAPVADLSFTSGTVGTCTVGLHTGILTFVASGSSVISISITAKSAVTAQATVTAT